MKNSIVATLLALSLAACSSLPGPSVPAPAVEPDAVALAAEADLQALLLQEPDSAAALNALGYILADRTERYQEALALIDRARLAEPDNAAIIDSYGWVLYRLGQLLPALEQLQRAWSLQREAEIGAHLAQVLLDLGRGQQAREIYRQARELDPENRAVQALHDRLGR